MNQSVTTTHLPDGTPVVFDEDTWDAIGAHLARELAAEDRLAHWRDEEALAEARHDLALPPV
jgi:hypothetical protein